MKMQTVAFWLSIFMIAKDEMKFDLWQTNAVIEFLDLLN